MNTGQRVRLRASSKIAHEWNIAQQSQGTVICRYRLLKKSGRVLDRLDVRFGPRLVVWGAPAREFEAIEERS